MRLETQFLPTFFGVIAFACAVNAKDDLSLTRVTPVPADQQVPLVDFIRPLLFGRPQLNPSGTRFAAFIENQHFSQNVLDCDIATGKFEWSDVGSDVIAFMWMNDSELRIVTTTGFRRRGPNIERFGGTDTVREVGDLDTVKEEGLMHGKYGAIEGTNRIIEPPLPILHGFPDLGVENAHWARPEDGKEDFCTISVEGKLGLYRVDGDSLVKSPIDPVEIIPVGVGSRPGEMIALGPRQEGRPRPIQYVDVATGALGKVLYQDERYDGLSEVYRASRSSDVVGFSIPYVADHAVWLDPKRQHVQEMINHFFPRSFGFIVGVDRTDDRFLIEEISDVKPPTYYLLDLAKRSMGLLKNTGPWVDPSRMRPMQTISYKARDGSPIDGYLTLPAGASKDHRVPLVVLPHSGPWIRDTWQWRGDVQFLANRGYAVLQPNYRGSAGYDWRFPADDRFDFTKMHNDVTDGTRALIKSGIIDPGRIAILGVGFGGYLAIRGAVDEPGLYRCALTVGGVFDWKEALDDYYTKKDPVYYPLRSYLQSRNSPDEVFAAISPIRRIESLKIPVFVTNNFGFRESVDVSLRSPQTLELSHDIPRNTPKVIFGDLHIDSTEGAFVDAVDRMKAIEEFLGKYLATAPSTAAP
jgi:pimeloyl-ACP methyl ester carboxylesterase